LVIVLELQIMSYTHNCDRLLGGGTLHEPRGTNIGGLEPLGPHEVGAYAHILMACLAQSRSFFVHLSGTNMAATSFLWRTLSLI